MSAMRTERDPTVYGLEFFAPGGALLAAVFILPIFMMLSRSILDPEPTLRHFVHIFREPVYLKVIWITFKISFTVTVSCVLLGYPIAYLLAGVRETARNLLMILVLVPFWTSLLVRNYAWMVLLGRNGVFNNIFMTLGLLENPIRMLHTGFAVNVGMTQMMMPFMILSMFSVMSGIDRTLLRASASLGANGFRTFMRVFLPLSMPGVGSGSLLVFIYSLGFFITPALLGGGKAVMLSMVIEEEISTLLNWGFASALALVLLACTFVFFFTYTRFFKIERIF
jgi:putative spermidine/putrescine transport system permease protein